MFSFQSIELMCSDGNNHHCILCPVYYYRLVINDFFFLVFGTASENLERKNEGCGDPSHKKYQVSVYIQRNISVYFL